MQMANVTEVIKCRLDHMLALTHIRTTLPIVVLHQLGGYDFSLPWADNPAGIETHGSCSSSL